MIFILEALSYYEDTWNITFYFVVAISLILGLFWTFYQICIKGEKKKEPLKENVIYNHSDDIIENYNMEPKKKDTRVLENNYIFKDNNKYNNQEDSNDTNNDIDINTETELPKKDFIEKDIRKKTKANNKNNYSKNNKSKYNNYSKKTSK